MGLFVNDCTVELWSVARSFMWEMSSGAMETVIMFPCMIDMAG